MSTVTQVQSTAPAARYRSTPAALFRRYMGQFLMYAVLIFVLVVTVAPVALMWSSAMKTRQQINENPLAPPSSFYTDNLVKAWGIGRFGRYALNSVIISVPTVLGVIAVSCLAGYGFAKHEFAGKRAFFILFLLGLMVPFQSIMIPLYFDLQKMKLLGTFGAMIWPAIGLGLPFGIYLMQSFFRGLPMELSDSAKVDGCNELQVFWHIILPLTTPAVSSLAIFQFVWTWNAFLMPLLYVNKEALRPMTLGLMFFQGRYTTDYSMVSAAVVITTLPIIVVYVLLQRQFLRGLTAGALKG